MFTFTAGQIAQILDAKTDQEFHTAYELIYTFISELDVNGKMVPKSGVDPAVWVWFWAAKDINDPNGSGVFRDFIRTYTKTQFEVRFGTAYSDQEVQKASNAIADRVLNDIVYRYEQADPNGLPSLLDIGLHDVVEAMKDFPDGLAAWSGNLLFPILGDVSPFVNNILGSESIYDLLALWKAGSEAAGGIDTLTDIFETLSGALRAVVNSQGGVFPTLVGLGNLVALAQARLVEAYGLDGIVGELDGASIKLGTLDGDDNFIQTTGLQFIHTSGGDDVVFGQPSGLLGGSVIIDGGEGFDTIQYDLADSVRLTILKRAVGADNYSGEITTGIEPLAFGDKLFGFEQWVGSLQDDTVSIGSFTTTFKTIDGGQGEGDVIRITQHYQWDVVFNNARSLVYGSDGPREILSILNFEKFEGGVGDDKFILKGSEVSIHGGGGVDTVDMSQIQAPSIGLDLISVERVIGSMFNDVIRFKDSLLEDLLNSLSGYGEAIVSGGGGSDILFGRNSVGGATHLWGGFGDPTNSHPSDYAGAEYLEDDHEADYLIGGNGKDIFYVGGDNYWEFVELWEAVDPQLYNHADTILNIQRQDEVIKIGQDWEGGVNARDWAGSYIFAGSSGSTSWYEGQGDLYGTYYIAVDNSAEGKGRVILSWENGGAYFVIGNFQNGDLGINLPTPPSGPEPAFIPFMNDANSSPDFSGVLALSGLRLQGGDGDDVLIGDDTDDVIIGGAGNDYLHGGDGDDYLDGGNGDDIIYGGGGDDIIVGSGGNDTLDGGDGFDILDYSATTSGVVVNLQLGSASGVEIGADTLAYIEAVIGGSGDDFLTGDAGDNILIGGDGFDTLIGGDGDDVLADYASRAQLVTRPDIVKGENAGNHSLVTALSVDGYFDLEESLDIEKASEKPHATIQASGSGDVDFYKFTATSSGQALSVDLDDVFYSAGRNGRVPIITLLDAQGAVLYSAEHYEHYYGASNDSDGEYFQYVLGAAGTYFVSIEFYHDFHGNLPVEVGDLYTLHISLDGGIGIAAAGTNVMDAGAGNDLIIGGLESDTIFAGAGNDTIIASSGNDSVDGGDGFDVIEFAKPFEEYDWFFDAGVLSVFERANNENLTTLVNVEEMVFAGGVSFVIEPGIAPNRAPVAGVINGHVLADDDFVLSVASILSEAWDPDGDTLSFLTASAAQFGTIAIVGGDIVFTPDAGFNDDFASFQYVIEDSRGTQTIGTVNIEVGDAEPRRAVVDLALDSLLVPEQRVIMLSELLAGLGYPNGEQAELTLEIEGQALGLYQSVDLPSGAMIIRVDETKYYYQANDAFDHLGGGALAEDVFFFSVIDQDSNVMTGMASLLTLVDDGGGGAAVISFALVSDDGGAAFLDNIVDLDSETLTPSTSIEDYRLISIVGNGDSQLEPGEIGYVISEITADGRLSSLDADNSQADIVVVTAHGRVSGGGHGDLTQDITFTNLTGFGVRNDEDGVGEEYSLNNGDSLHFEVNAGLQDFDLELVAFTVVSSGVPGAGSLVFDVDGEVISETGGNLVTDGLVALNNLSDGDYVEIDIWNWEVRVNNVVQLADFSVLFEMFSQYGARGLTIGTPSDGGAGIGLKDLSFEVFTYSYPLGGAPEEFNAALIDFDGYSNLEAVGGAVPRGGEVKWLREKATTNDYSLADTDKWGEFFQPLDNAFDEWAVLV